MAEGKGPDRGVDGASKDRGDDTAEKSILETSLDRRKLLARAGIMGIGIAGVGGLLAACGGDDDEASTAAGPGTE